MRETKKIWMNGELVDWADATVHVGTHGLHYGSGVFEGIRAYETERGTSVFRLTDHLERLQRSAQLLYMDLPYSVEELQHGDLGPDRRQRAARRATSGRSPSSATASSASRRSGNPVDVAIMSWPWGAYLGEEGQRNGIRAKVSSWQRVGPNVIPHVAKATGVYLNSMLAVGEANRAGYDEAILLTAEGYVADGSGESIFLVRDGVIYTPDLSASILVGHHARHRDPDRAGSRPPRRREADHPHRPLSRRRGVHGRHGRRGDADPRDRRPGHRAARPRHAGDPGGVPRHRARAQRTLEPVARVRAGHERSREA